MSSKENRGQFKDAINKVDADDVATVASIVPWGEKCPREEYLPSGFTISENALIKMQTKSGSCQPEQITEIMLAQLEKSWREKEKCLIEYHEKTTGLSMNNLQQMEDAISTQFRSRYPCDYGQPVVDCYNSNPENPLCCAEVVKTFVECVEGARNQITLNTSQQSKQPIQKPAEDKGECPVSMF